ncbi:MAG: HAD family hydrolase [Victivallales bacterium]|nr:HAD family hydrolase [Victivallales bacterium]
MALPYFIGIDSDGTAFDSMTIKHRHAFIPAMIEVWNLQAYSAKVYEICEHINLYSRTRGIDRFSGLQLTFESFEKAGIPVPDYSALKGFLASGKLSNATLTAYLKDHDDPYLRDVLRWSAEADLLFQKNIETQPPFQGILPVLKHAAGRADIAVISSASEASLRSDWQKENLVSYVTKVYGQEFGGKKAQLAVDRDKYAPGHMLMLGDAPGDLDAAQANGALFFPIIPGHEEESWTDFDKTYLELFLNGKFDNTVQAELLAKFNSALGD